MHKIFSKMLLDSEKMAKIKGHPFREVAFFALYKHVNSGGSLLELPWFAASASLLYRHPKKSEKLAA